MEKKPMKYINRELSWLSFNDRVLQEAADPTVPLLDRLKFLGIYSSNLDEFFSVRVGTLRRMHDAGFRAKTLLGGTPKKILKEIHEIVIFQRDKFEQIYENLKNELERENIFFVDEKQLNPEQQAFVKSYFQTDVRPRLVPIMLDTLDSFPYLKNQVIYLAVYLERIRRKREVKYALIEIPADVLPRFLVLPEYRKKNYIIILDDIIRMSLQEIFAIFDFENITAYTIKLTRDAELDIDDVITKSFFEKVSKSVKERQKGQPVRFVYDQEIPADLLEFILHKNNLKNFEQLIPGGRYHNARDFIKFPRVKGRTKCLETKKELPLSHELIVHHKSIFNAIREQDILLHYPYHSFHHIIDLLREAAIDPQVTSIKMTMYRLAEKSNVINTLINASRNGKKVVAVMELQARFDEEANIFWTKKLEEEENVRIIGGVPGLKVHAKICLITRIENDNQKQYACIGTGNFNETTAKIYSDHTLLTSNKQLTREVNKVFKFLENNYKTYNYKHLLVSPFYMRTRLRNLITNEINNASKGKEAYILLKLNSLVDREMIDRLYKASQAGVKIRMIVRGICSLLPGIEGVSENIEVISILDKYLEHSRIFIFCNDGADTTYISSADWMVRNLDNRIEVAAPINDEKIKDEIKKFLELQFRDNKKARVISERQDNNYKGDPQNGEYRAQVDIYNLIKSFHK